MRTKIFILLVVVLSAVSVAAMVQAAGYGLEATGERLGYNAGETIFTIVNRVVSGVLALVGIIFLGMMLYAGIRWMTARSNEELSSKAKDTLSASIIGLVIVVGSYGITTLAFRRLGVQGAQPTAPTAPPPPAVGCCIFTSKASQQVTKCNALTAAQCTAAAISDFETVEWKDGANCQVESSCKALATKQSNPSGICYAKTDCYNAKNEASCQDILCNWKMGTCVDFSAAGNAACIDFTKPSDCGSHGCVWASEGDF